MSKHHLENGDSHPPKRRRGGKGGKGGGSGDKASGKGISIVGLGVPKRYAFKVLCSDPLAANLIGKEGKTRAQIEEETGTSVWISKRNELYPSPQFRLLILHADEPDQVLAALELVVPRLVDVAERDKELGESPLIGKDDGEYVFHCALPAMIRGKLIGSKGANIKDLRERTGAKIFVDNEVYSGHHATRVIGVPEKIREVLKILNDAVQEAADTEDFASWIVCQPEAASSQDRRRSPPRDRHREPPRDRSPRRDASPKRQGRNRGRRPAQGGIEDQLHDEGNYQEEFPSVPDGPPLEAMIAMVENRTIQRGALDLSHALNVMLPANEAPSVEFKQFVEDRTHTKMTITETEDLNSVEVMIVGPLLETYLAHFLVMQQVHEMRARQEAEQQQHENAAGADVEALRAQVEALQKQLATVAANQQREGKGRR